MPRRKPSPARRTRNLRILIAVVAVCVVAAAGLLLTTDHDRVSRRRVTSVSVPQDRADLAAAGGEFGAMGSLTGVPPDWTTSVHRFDIDGLARSYLVVRPKSPAAAVLPVVVVLHGRGETPAGIERLTDAPEVTGPAILVFPAGYGRSWNAGECCGVAHRSEIDDVEFLSEVVRRVLASEPATSPSDVYLLGFSNGARMADRMACARPGAWAGIGMVEAVPATSCPATTPLPVVVVANPHDPFFNLNPIGPPKIIQGYVEPSMQASVADWRALDGCTGVPTLRRLGTTTVQSWDACRGNGEVTYAIYKMSGHSWPADVSESPGATDLLWSLLRFDRLPVIER